MHKKIHVFSKMKNKKNPKPLLKQRLSKQLAMLV